MDNDKKEFAKRLRGLMDSRGWNQAETARRSGMGRDNISCYLKEKTMPERAQVLKIAKAFSVSAEDLVPNDVRAEETLTEMQLKLIQQEDGNFYLRVGQTVEPDVAAQIMKLLSKK